MIIPIISFVILIVTALLTSILSGITGMGGGTILLAVIAMVVDISYVVPLHASVQLVSNSTRLILFFKHIKWKIILYFLIGVLPGAFLGIYIFKMLDKNLIKLLMGIFILVVTYLPKSKKETTSSYKIFLPIGFVSGFIGIFFGAIGPFIAPFFIRKDIIKEELVATKAACQAITHLIKIPLFGFIGLSIVAMWEVFAVLSVIVIIGTYIGKKLLLKISDDLFKKIFKFLLTLLALKIIITQLLQLF